MTRYALKLAATAALAFALAACGGGGGSGVASTPPPPVNPPPPPQTSSAVDIFPSPATQEFVTIGIGSDMRIRYDAATNKYEVMAGNLGWTQLVDDPLSAPLPGSPNQMFVFAGAPTNESAFIIRVHHSFSDPTINYQYSNLAQWVHGPANVGGLTAFGVETPVSGVPVTGSATYNGFIEGYVTETVDWGSWGVAAGSIGGPISLAFNFGSGSLSGSISPTLSLDKAYSLGTISFKNPVYSTGSTSFSGQFDTNVSGNNSFSGLFTGPNAQELIGKFALPYTSPVTGTPQQAEGAFIAKH